MSKDVADLLVMYCNTFHLHKQLDEYIFYKKRNGITTQMSADNFARFMQKYENQLRGIKPDITHLHPHLFHHTRAMHLYMAGMPPPLVPEWLGHSQLETTSIYARATTEMKRRAAEKITNVENSVFKYENDDEVIKRLYGLA
ncbi:tyrosine-type recombinase/integrase [Clostridium botulinum]|nr:tyrosine-type recombinase/integrase [Clostridium botulinum]